MIDPLDLHAYIDGELNSEQAVAIRSRLEEFPEAAREAEAIRSLKVLLAEMTQPPESHHAWVACVRRLDELDKTKESAREKRIETIVARFAPGLCLVLLACILIVPRISHRNNNNLSGPDIAGALSPMPATGPSKHQVDDFERWMHNLIKDSERLVVKGVRKGWLDDVPLTQFLARDQQGNLEVYKIDEPLILKGTVEMTGHPDLMCGNINGVNCVVQNDGPTTLIIVAPRTWEDLAALVKQVTPK